MVYTRFNSYVFVLRTNLEPNGGEDRVVKKKKKYRAILFRRIDGTSFLFAIIFLPFVVKIPRGKFVKILFRMIRRDHVSNREAVRYRETFVTSSCECVRYEGGNWANIPIDWRRSRRGERRGYTCPLRDVEGGDGGVRRETKQRRVGMDEIVGTF